ncbi:MAG TPA: ribonuclease III [Verrucomicrobiae bacterium]|jgi:ribonuclease-3|nr:ribonuclease III [Verrucomicrobiae bacterium]
MMNEDLKSLETVLGHKFRRPELLERALTHSSHANEESRAAGLDAGGAERLDNEQFEFLGDAVLGLVTSHLLFERFPGFHEGQLSKLKAHLVSAGHLVGVGARMDLGQYLRLGRGEERSGGRAKSTLLSDAAEAVIAALYLDAGLEKTTEFIVTQILEPELERLGQESNGDFMLTDYKSALQELLQSSGRSQPVYSTIKEEGPDHRKTFTVEARVYPQGQNRPEYVARAEGATKKKAEQLAAKQALEHLRAHPDTP